MSFAKRHQQIVKKIKVQSEKRLWLNAFIFGLVIFGLAAFYLGKQRGDWSLNMYNRASADTAVILIGLSFILSGVCYFWDFADTKIVYRKQLGLLGAAFGLIHVLLTVVIIPKGFSLSYWLTKGGAPFWTGLGAVAIFAVMAAVSNRYSAFHLGGLWWRRVLRFGYVAVALVLTHVFLLKSVYWLRWLNGGAKTLPSLSLIVSAFIVSVLLMRIALEFSLRSKRR